MKAISIVSAVVFLHVFAFITLVNGCRSTSDPSYQNLGKPIPQEFEEPAQGQEVGSGVLPEVEGPAQGNVVNPAVAEDPKKGESQAVVVDSPALTYYVVKPGESLSLIAHRHKITSRQLAAANNLELNATLRSGKKLVIPPPVKGNESSEASGSTAKPQAGEIYVVKKGDVLGTIARKAGTSVAKIKEANNLKSDNIRVGQKLRIPAKKPVDAAKADPASALMRSQSGANAQPAKEQVAEPETTAVPETTIDPADEDPASGQPV